MSSLAGDDRRVGQDGPEASGRRRTAGPGSGWPAGSPSSGSRTSRPTRPAEYAGARRASAPARSGAPSRPSLPNGFQTNWASSEVQGDRRDQRPSPRLVDRPGQRDRRSCRPTATRRTGPTMLPSGQSRTSSGSAAQPRGHQPRGRARGPPGASEQQAEPAGGRPTAVLLARAPRRAGVSATKTIRKMWTRTCVPDQRPRLIGDHVRGSVIMRPPAAGCGPSDGGDGRPLIILYQASRQRATRASGPRRLRADD